MPASDGEAILAFVAAHVQGEDFVAPAPWRKNRRLMREGWKDLAYLPRGRRRWSMTLAAQAYSLRRRIAGRGDLNLWAAMHAAPASARYAKLGERALVLWHGTSAARAEKIREVGLFPKKGIWATAEPRLAHSFTRDRADRYRAGGATIVLLFDREDMPQAFEPASQSDTLRFRSPLGPEYVEYILWDDRIEFVGPGKARSPKPWGVARFKKVGGKWAPRSRPPVRFGRGDTYKGLAQWSDLSVRRVLTTLGEAAAMEVFSSLYATIDPTEALGHDDVFAAMERLCPRPRYRRVRLFSLADETGA